MANYLKGVLEDFPEVITGRDNTPAVDCLFHIRDDKDRKLLEEKQSIAFHHSVAQLEFAITRARKDTHAIIEFLTTESASQMRMTEQS
jgi:hypothetical protein